MAKKMYPFNVLSDKRCEERFCGRKLKLRLVETKAPHNITRCYQHHRLNMRRVQSEKDMKGRDS